VASAESCRGAGEGPAHRRGAIGERMPATHVKPVPATAAGRYVRGMKVVFTSWLAAIAVGLAYMYAIALSGR
jgi:hypothetical protein